MESEKSISLLHMMLDGKMYANRINALPPYLFATIDELKAEKRRQGINIIDFSIGDPDRPTPEHVVEAMRDAVLDPSTHRYPPYEGMPSFREAAAKWYKKRFGVKLNPEDEVLTLIGSKEGIVHLPLAFINPGDVALVPDPAYPVYRIGTILAGGTPHIMPLLAENGFKPDLDSIDAEIAKKAKLMFLNYPNNPTAAIADENFFKEVVDFASDNDIIVCHDNAYSEVTYDGYKAPALLQIKGAMDIGVEFHSLSKTYNMTGWRLGFAVGNAEVLAGLGKVKTNVDSGVFNAIQMAGIAALEGSQNCVKKMIAIYRERRDVLVRGLESLGTSVEAPKATFYIWAPVPRGYGSLDFSRLLLDKAGIVATPGIGFGDYGEGYLRFALTEPVERIKEAVERMRKLEI